MSQTDQPKSSQKWMIIPCILIGLSVVFCGGPLTWWFARRSNAFGELAEKRDEIRARGLPIDDESMEAYRYQLMGHEKSDRWMNVLEQLDSEQFQASCTGIPVIGVSEDDVGFVPGQPYKYDADVSEFLESWKDLREEIHEIAEGTDSTWTEVKMDSFNTEIPYVQPSRAAARLLVLEFEDAVRRDDSEQAFQSLMALIGVSRAFEEDPILITQLVHIALSGVAVQKIKQAVELDLLDENQLQTILDQLKTFDDFGSKYRMAIAGERAMSQPVFDDISSLSEDELGIPFGFRQRPIDALASLDLISRAESIPTDDLTGFLTAVQELTDQINDEMERAGPLRKFETVLTGLVTPAFSAFGEAVARSAMEMRIAKIGIGIRLFEKSKGRLPPSLDELTDDDATVELGPIDPIGYKPFGFRVIDGDVEVWGFRPMDATDVTPDEPPEFEDFPEADDYMKYWYWKLSPGDTIETGDSAKTSGIDSVDSYRVVSHSFSQRCVAFGA